MTATRPASGALTGLQRAIQFARSDDGLIFTIDEKTRIDDAASPALVQLVDGRLMLVFERRAEDGEQRLAGSFSDDAGRAWSSPQTLRLDGLPERFRQVGSPQLVRVARDRVLLIFRAEDQKHRTSIMTAMWKEGDAFRVRGPVRFERQVETPRRLHAALMGADLHVFGARAGAEGLPFHGMLSEGGRVAELSVAGREFLAAGGTIVTTPECYRWYGPVEGELGSASSRDGVTWVREAGGRLPGVDIAAAVRTADGKTLLAFNTPAGRSRLAKDRRRRTAARASDEHGEDVDNDGAGAVAAESTAETEAGLEETDVAPTNGDETGGEHDEGLAKQRRASGADATDAAADEPAIDADTGPAEDDAAAWQSWDEWPPADGAEGYGVEPPVFSDVAEVPMPDFERHINYMEWFRQSRETQMPWPNAWDFYDRFIPNPDDRPGDKPPLPDFVNMFRDPVLGGAPGPWNPLEHPAWEATFLATADLKSAFAQAAAIEGFVRPLFFAAADDSDAAGPVLDRDEIEARNLMINIMLPDLAAHRRVVGQMLADAWRAPEGGPDAGAMLSAFRTSLGSANHLDTGVFLIDRLVSINEREMVESNARWALHHGVFDEAQMQEALEILSAHDAGAGDPMNWIRGELACSMDLTQYVYGPVEPGREPALNPSRYERVFKGFNPEGRVPQLSEEEIATSRADATRDAFEDYYRDFVERARQGYPQTTARDLNELTQTYIHRDPVLREMLPVLGRVYTVINRHEASRRATQLSYAIHLHKARTGAWPQSLDELPYRPGADARTDPFTQQDFGYRLTPEGPVVYSLSENGADDGGVHRERWGDGEDGAEGDDYVFWPPQPRGR